jgi:PBP1b-binding outer membrane lipoprotein LpoB
MKLVFFVHNIKIKVINIIMKKFLYLSSLLCPFLLTGCMVGPGVTDFSYDVSNNYELTQNNPIDVYVLPKDGYEKESEIIPPKVVKIAWNDRFVIAKQQVIKEPKKSENGIGKPTNAFNYWILDTKIRQRYGPFNKKTFDKKLKEFGIPNSLKLQDVESYMIEE